MSKRLEYSYVKAQIESTGYTLLSDTYKSIETNLKLRCPKDHEFKATYHNFVTLGTRCPTCNNIHGFRNNKNSYEYIKSKFESEGYKLISTEYKNNRQKLDVICPEGHIYKVSSHAFFRGRRCKKCYTIKRNWSELPKLSNEEKYNGEEGKDYVCCKICDYRCIWIDARHLRTKHNLTKKEYLELYPDALLSSENKIKMQSRISKGNKARLGMKNSEETKRKISEAHKGKEGFKPTVETIEKAKRTRKKVLLERYGVENVAQIQSVRESLSEQAVTRLLNVNNKFGSGRGKNGHFFSVKNNKEFFYRSSYEKKYMELLEKDKDVFIYDTEAMQIKYEFEGCAHSYIPDFIINNDTIVEVKSVFMLKDEKVIAKALAGKKFADENDMIYKIVTTSEIDELVKSL